jgi:hypothetical protein
MTWYHGTTEKHANAIINHGIDWQLGRPKKDFSNGKGFYLQDNLQSAVEWAERLARNEEERFGRHPVFFAVLVFRFTESELETMNWRYNQPTFDENNLEAFTRVVQFYR